MVGDLVFFFLKKKTKQKTKKKNRFGFYMQTVQIKNHFCSMQTNNFAGILNVVCLALFYIGFFFVFHHTVICIALLPGTIT